MRPPLAAALTVALTSPAAAAPVFIDAHALKTQAPHAVTVIDARAPWRYRAGHIPGAVNAPWHAFTASRKQGQLRPTAALQAKLQQLGVRADRPVVVYDRWHAGWGEAGRLFWTLEYLGHPKVQVLRGGFAAWDGPVETSPPSPAAGDFQARPHPDRRLTGDQAAALAQAGRLLDVRTAEEFAGATPHGAARGGHVPGATHLPWKAAFDGQGRLKPKAQVKALFEAAGVAFDQPAGAYCTGGIRSGFAYLLLRWLDHPAPANYDGSWWAWAADQARPVAR